MITSVDDEARHRDLPSLEAKIGVERKQVESRRDADVETRQKRLEDDIAALEAEGAKSDAKRKVRESAEREMNQIRKRADAEIERIDNVWDRFKNLKVQDLEGDEILYREMRDRFGMYFQGGMGAAALQKRASSPSTSRPRPSRCARSSAPARARRRPARSSGSRSSPRSSTPATPRWAWSSTASRSSRRTCARWCSSTVAASRPPTSTTSTAG